MISSRAALEAELKKSPIDITCGECGYVSKPRLGSLIGKTRYACPKCGVVDDLSVDPGKVLKEQADDWMRVGKKLSRRIDGRGVR